jgi:glycosyltransferase involved in cell wall biosynthesis
MEAVMHKILKQFLRTKKIKKTDQSTICLSMIVKNEVHIIARCLRSVLPLIDYWVIVDTGSTDGTQDKIRSILQGTTGELHERPWKDFATNRTEAIELARNKATFLLVIDADDALLIPRKFILPKLTQDSYSLKVEDADLIYWRKQLFRATLDFHYAGILHEVLTSTKERSTGKIDGLIYQYLRGGSRSADPNKYHKDAKLLEEALQTEPENSRYAFYLAQSWRDANEHEKALAAYQHRATMGGWEEEVYYSLYEIGELSVSLGLDDQCIIDRYLKAHAFRPTRAEPLYSLAVALHARGRQIEAYPFARKANEIPYPNDSLFVNDAVYTWCALDQYAVAASWAGHKKEAFIANTQLLTKKALPKTERSRIHKNLALCR